ncbi:hypothetical protein ULF88_01640 [Halopseudomonas pachastrellae]|nr:hypothetical protein [Halopseudomonas pachastrellae]
MIRLNVESRGSGVDGARDGQAG